MSTSIDEIHQQLSEIEDKQERIEFLLKTARNIHSSEPVLALQLADESLSLARACKDRRGIAECLRVKGLAEMSRGNSSDCLELLQQALAQAQMTGDQFLIANALHAIGSAHTSTNNFVEAIKVFNECSEIARTIDNNILDAKVHNGLAGVYHRIGDLAKTLEHAMASLAIFEAHGDVGGQIQMLGNIGLTYLNLENGEKALDYFLKASALIGDNAELRTRMVHTSHLVDLYNHLKDYDRALEFNHEMLKLSRVIGDSTYESVALYSIGMFHYKRSEYDLALQYLEEVRGITEECNDGLKWRVLAGLGRVYFAMQEDELGLPLLQRALEGMRADGMRQYELEMLELLSNHYEKSGRFAEAFEHYKLAMEIKEQLQGQEQQRAIAQLEMRAEIERAEKEREIFRLKSAQLEQEMEHKAKELTSLAMNLVEKNQFLDALKREMSSVVQEVDGAARPKVRSLLRQVEGNIGSEKEWKTFEAQFEKVHQGFIKELSQRYPELTRTELKVCALLKINMTTKEIADLLNSSVRTVETHRLRIRKKLVLPPDTNLSVYFASM
jgi:tetratricopeptide (TPR) repeat protein/DNA-binding CsgD family transcriptional regulator